MATARRVVVDHLVFFQVKPDTAPDRVASFIDNLNALRSLPGVLYLSAGPALPAVPAATAAANSAGSAVPPNPWTHALLGRYESRDALQAYAVSPEHVRVVNESVKPIISDIAAVDWETEIETESGSDTAEAAATAPSPPSHASVHTAMIQWQQSASPDAIAAAVSDLKSKLAVSSPSAVSVGENFAPARAKCFTWGLAVFAEGEALGEKLWDQEGCKGVLGLAERIDCVHLKGAPVSS